MTRQNAIINDSLYFLCINRHGLIKMKIKLKNVLPVALLLAASLLLNSCANETGEEMSAEETTLSFSDRRYDWGTVAETEEVSDDNVYEFAFNKYAVSENRLASLSESGLASYAATVDAIENYTQDVRMESSDVDAVVAALLECYPPAALVTSLEFEPDPVETDADTTTNTNTDTVGRELAPAADETTANETTANETTAADETAPAETDADGNPVETEPAQTSVGGTLHITYLLTADEHSAKLNSFYSGCAKLLGLINATQSEEVKAFLLYSLVSKTINDVTGRRLHCFDTLLAAGNIQAAGGDVYTLGGASQASVLHYLYLQAGLKCALTRGWLGDSARMWNAVEIDGAWFYCDPSSENSDTSGNGLRFFGMTESDRVGEGYSAPFTYGGNVSGRTVYLEVGGGKADFTLTATDTRYSFLRDCDFYAINDAATEIVIYHEGVSEPEIYTMK